jgi:hypothetical protein
MDGNLLRSAPHFWTHFSRQGQSSGPEPRTDVLAGGALILIALVEPARSALGRLTMVLQVYSVCSRRLLSNALRVWPTSRAFLFGNLIPVTTMALHVFLGDPVTSNF